MGKNKIIYTIIVCLLLILEFILVGIYGIEGEIFSLLMYVIYIVIIIFAIFPYILHKKLSIIQIILSILICIGLPWLAITGIALGALNEVPEYIFIIGSTLYLVMYIFTWFYPIFINFTKNYKKLLLLVILNLFASISLFYLIILIGFRSYF